MKERYYEVTRHEKLYVIVSAGSKEEAKEKAMESDDWEDEQTEGRLTVKEVKK